MRGFAVGLLIAIAILAAGGAWFQREILTGLPDVGLIVDWRPPQAARVLDRHGIEIDTFYLERRFWLPIGAVPEHVIDAFVAAEDERFFEHPGVDVVGIARALRANWRAGAVVQGGSTISQQLVKNLLVGHDRTLRRKMKEAVLAWRLERRIDKRGILELYLNYVFMGEGNYGIEAASRSWFGVSVRDVDVGQAALLAGVVPAPSRYAPGRHPEAATERREHVLKRMVMTGALTPRALDLALRTPILAPDPDPVARGGASYITEVRRELRRVVGTRHAATAGFVVHTALDPAIQTVAEEAVAAAIRALAERQRRTDEGPWAQGAAVVMDHRNGEVLALVGGRDVRLEGFVRATQALRQPGSSFKPYVYAAALLNGRSQMTDVSTDPVVVRFGRRVWSPQDGGSGGELTLRDALTWSSNNAAVRLLKEVGAEEVVRVGNAMGIRSNLRPDTALALGASEVTPMDQAVGFSTIARLGVPIEPVLVRRLEDGRGRVAHPGEEIRLDGVVVGRLPGAVGEPAIPPGVAYELLDMLRQVVARGTGRAGRKRGFDRAGKTGTTNDSVDTWFVGMTPRYTVSIWIGTDMPEGLGWGESGSMTALPAWKQIVDALPADPDERFPIPPDVSLVPVGSGTIALRRGTAPGTLLPLHRQGREPLPPFPGSVRQ